MIILKNAKIWKRLKNPNKELYFLSMSSTRTYAFIFDKGESMKIVEVAKMVGNVATGLGVGKTIDLVLKSNLPVNLDWRARIATFIGSSVISGYISAKCGEYVEEEIDKIAGFVENVKTLKSVNIVEPVDIEIKEDEE